MQPRTVFLVNILAPNMLPVFQQVQRMLDDVTILVSAENESNRQWNPIDDAGLDLRVQKTWTRTQRVKHPGGYVDELYVHVPYDTLSQLRRLRPDCVVSLEMGMRSLATSFYRCVINRRCRHVLSYYGSEHIDSGRGRLRHVLRRRLVRQADIVTYNGPSCRRYLESIGTDRDKLMPWYYSADPEKVYRGEITSGEGEVIRLLTVGQFIERKGVLPAMQQVVAYATANRDQQIHWTLVGNGPLADQLKSTERPPNLTVSFEEFAQSPRLRELYASHDALLFPTLGDEWGLVVDEALQSGMLVLGSVYSQAAMTLIDPGQNGWQIDLHDAGSLAGAIDALLQLPIAERLRRRQSARAGYIDRGPQASAQQFVDAVMAACS